MRHNDKIAQACSNASTMASPQRTSPRRTSRSSTRNEGPRRCSVSVWFLVLSNILVFQLTYFYKSAQEISSPSPLAVEKEIANQLSAEAFARQQQVILNSSSLFVLDFPRGEAVALPSIRISDAEEKVINRKHYGGAYDKKHLGGFTEIDLFGISPAVWKNMVTYFGVKSLLDVGCGRGISTSWFALHGVDTLCVEGSHDAVTKTILPDPSTQLVEHDFARGPWWPSRTYDALWCVEFLEHVGRNFHHNFLPAFRKAALLFVTHSQWGGWHHVEVHNERWWLSKFEAYGFRYSQDLTSMVRRIAVKEQMQKIPSMTGEPYNAQHLWNKLIVLINPTVAALPEHAHLFAEHGCYHNRSADDIGHRECGTGGRAAAGESVLPKSFYPIALTDDMDKEWEDLVKKNIKQK